MENTVYILCQEENSNTILQAFDAVFGTATANSGVNHGTLQNEDFTIEIISYGQNLGKECAEFIKQQQNAVCGHFSPIDTKQIDIKINLFHQLRGSKGFVYLKYFYPGCRSTEMESMIYTPLFAVLAKVRGLLLIDEGSTLLNEHGQMVLSDKGESQLEWYMPYVRPVPEGFFNNACSKALRRRNENLAKIQQRHIYILEWLPLIEGEKEASFRTAKEIAGRAAALMAVALYSEYLLQKKKTIAQARIFIQPVIDCYKAASYFSPAEKAYLKNNTPTEQACIRFSWQYEALFVMLWALGYEKELFYPDRLCNVSALVHTMREHDSIEALLKDAKPRDADLLLDAADMIYCLDWACVDARLHGFPAPGKMDNGVVTERHKALHWLVHAGNWDHTDLST